MSRAREPKINLVSKKIDKLVAAEREAHPERLVAFFARLQTNYDEAIRAASSFFLLMLLAWFLTYAIYERWIEKFTLVGLELNRRMIVAAPLLIGLLSYGMLSAMAGAVIFWEAVSRGVFHMMRTAWEHSLDDLLAPPSFSNVERMLEPEPKWRRFLFIHKWPGLPSLFSGVWFGLVSLMMFGGSAFAVGYTIWLFFQPCLEIHPAAGAASAVLGVVAWLRGFALFIAAINATGGFTPGHHRGSGRYGVGSDTITAAPDAGRDNA
jgi:hypothetical protein